MTQAQPEALDLKSNPIAHAASLLRIAANELADGISINGEPDWATEPETHAAYVEHMSAAQALEQWGSAIGAGGVEPLRRQCLHQIAEPGGWIVVADRLPVPGEPVLLDIGKKFPIRAMWAAKHTVESHDEADPGWCDYDEATDTYYCPEGWYEWNEHEEVHWFVSETPRAWCSLPPSPTPTPPSAEGGS
jgi:hypothetical protein